MTKKIMMPLMVVLSLLVAWSDIGFAARIKDILEGINGD